MHRDVGRAPERPFDAKRGAASAGEQIDDQFVGEKAQFGRSHGTLQCVSVGGVGQARGDGTLPPRLRPTVRLCIHMLAMIPNGPPER